jgi:hypothetical protein
MKNDPFPRPNLASRVSPLDGSIHPNQALRDAHDAMKRSQEAMNRAQDAARRNRENFNRVLRTPRSLDRATPLTGHGARGRVVVGLLLVVVILALAWLSLHK